MNSEIMNHKRLTILFAGALLCFLSRIAVADTPPDLVLEATVLFSTKSVSVESRIKVVPNVDSPLGFSVPDSTEPVGNTLVKVVPEQASSKGELSIHLPTQLRGFLALDGTQLYYGKRLIAADLFVDDQAPLAGASHRRNQANRRIRPNVMVAPQPPESKHASASKVLQFIRALGAVRFCPEAIQISIQSIIQIKHPAKVVRIP